MTKIIFDNSIDVNTGKKVEIVTSKTNRLLRTRKLAKKSAEWFVKNFERK